MSLGAGRSLANSRHGSRLERIRKSLCRSCGIPGEQNWIISSMIVLRCRMDCLSGDIGSSTGAHSGLRYKDDPLRETYPLKDEGIIMCPSQG